MHSGRGTVTAKPPKRREWSARHGLRAASPIAIPWRGWLDVLKRVGQQVARHRIGLTAAGVAFHGLLALFPALVAMISFWGLFADPSAIVQQMDSASTLIPSDAKAIINDQVIAVASGRESSMSLAFIIGSFVAVFSAARGAKAIMQALNVVYGENETRGVIKFNLVATFITVAVSLWFLLSLGAVMALPLLFALAGLEVFAEAVIRISKWPLLLFAAWIAVAALFRYAPCRSRAKWSWVTPGATLAVALWLIASALFSLYVENFASYNATYGALGVGVILLMWFWVSAFVVLLGAELDAELERQTEVDTTTGPERPMGDRGAFVADYPSPARSPAEESGVPPDPRT